MNIFLAPRSNEQSYQNFESTIVGGREYKFLEPYLSESEKGILSKYPVLSVWGNKESLKSRWEQMRPGDYVLFYAHGFFYYSARVILTKFDKNLAEKLWPAEDGKPWSCLFFVDNIQEINIPIEIIQELASYEPSWDRVQGFMRLNDNGQAAIVSKYGSVESFIKQAPALSRVIERIREEKEEEQLIGEMLEEDRSLLLKEASAYKQVNDGYIITDGPRKVRNDNKKQKEIIATLENYTCQVCGWRLEWTNKNGKKKFRIDIDHIIEKSKGGTEEANNLWALCPNCHAKKTAGVIVFDKDKKIITENSKQITIRDNHNLL